MARLTWLRRRVRWVGLGLIMAAGLGAALGGTLVGAPALASEGSGVSGCPSSNPPNQMTLVAGTPQTAILGSGVCDRLAGGAQQQRWLPRHERRRGDPRHVQRTLEWCEWGVLQQRV